MANDLEMNEALVALATAIEFATEMLTGKTRDFVLVVFDQDAAITAGRIGAIGNTSKERTADALQFALGKMVEAEYVHTGITH